MGRYIYQVVLTPDEEGGYDASVPDLPGCYSWGETLMGASEQAADAMRTYVASLVRHGEPVPQATEHEAAPGESVVAVYFETDADYIVDGEVVSAAEAARRLKVSPGRVTRLLDSGILDGYRKGRRTYVTVSSVDARLAERPAPGRPRRKTVA